jgi:hypothetical protein
VAAQALTRAELKHVVDRVSFGLTPAQLQTITTVAQLNAWLQAQLQAPSVGYGGAADALITGAAYLNEGGGLTYGNTTWTLDELQAKQIVLALESPYQLREVMTWFWEQHFSTFYFSVVNQVSLVQNLPASTNPTKAALFHEWHENQTYRALALRVWILY